MISNHFKFFLIILSLCNFSILNSQTERVTLNNGKHGSILQIDGKDFYIKGMNWDYFPIGTNYSFILWEQSDSFIKKALDDEMKLLKKMGVNTIRVYTGIQPKWITYIHERYGIYTILNHSFGRYGLLLDEVWTPNTDYSDERAQKLLLKEVKLLALKYKETRGLLLYLIGNENNYGLSWKGAETEDIPIEEAQSEKRATDMYRLFNKAANVIKSGDTSHLVSICNGDLQFLNLIAQECQDFDIFGTNIYRGNSFGDTFEKMKNELGKPILLTEFGADAYNSKFNKEDQQSQASYLKNNWLEVYENSFGLGLAGNCIGGLTFQFSDGWWKNNQTTNLDIHDTVASWSNGGYIDDYSAGQNNMNEEWFGICSKGPTNATGHYKLQPRKAYFTLKEIHCLDPLQKGMTIKKIKKHFDKLK